MTPFVILFTGSRSLPDPRVVARELSAIALYEVPDRHILVRHGACPGPKSADQAVTEWMRQNGEWFGATEDPQPADWDHCAPDCPTTPGHRRTKRPGDIHHPGLLPDYCPGAGPRRNAGAVALGADLCLAAPHGASYGTRGCMRLARAAGIPVREVTA